MEVDFHSMKRKQLQALCKKHVIPANLTNLEMANRLSSLLKETENSNAYEPSSSSNLVVEVSNKIDSAVVTRKAKKVRFSRENETFIFLQSDAKVTTIRKRTRRTFKKDPSEVERSALKKQVERRRISERLNSLGSEMISISSEAESSAKKEPVGKRRVSKKSNSSDPVGTENVDVIEKLPEVVTTPWKLRSRGFAGEKGNVFDDGDVEASKKNVPLKQQGRITRQSKCQLNVNSTMQHGDGKTESGSIKVVPEIIAGKKSVKRTSNLVCKEEIKVQVEPQDKGAVPRRSRRISVGLQAKDPQEPVMKAKEQYQGDPEERSSTKAKEQYQGDPEEPVEPQDTGAVPRRSRRISVGLQAKDPQEPVMKANEVQDHLPVRRSSRCVSKRQSFVPQNSIQEAKTKKQRRSSIQPLAKRTSETESFEVSNEKSEHVVDFTATNHSEAQVPRTSRRSIRAYYPQESVMKENELQSQVLLRQSSRCASKCQSLAPSNSVSVAQAKKQKSSSLQSLAKEHVVDLTAVAESVGVENPVEVEKEIVQLVEDKVNDGSCVVSHKTASLTSYLDCKDVFLKLNAVRDSETELSSEKKLCSIHEELLCVDRMDKSNDNKYTVAVQMNISGSPVNVTNGTENDEFNELQNQRTAQPSVESVPIAPAYLRDQETAFVAEVQCSGQSYSRIADTDENAEQDETSGNQMSPKHSEVTVIVSESLQDGVACLISGEEKHDLEGHVDYATRDHSLGLREDTRESPANMTFLDATESKTMKCTDATELQESKGVHVSGDSISLETTFDDKGLVSDAKSKGGKENNEEDEKLRDNENDNGLSFLKVPLSAERDSTTESQSRFQIVLEEYNASEKSSYSPEQTLMDEEENAPINLSLQFSQNALVGKFTCREDDDRTDGLSSAANETDEAGPKLSDYECQNNAIEKGSQEDSHIPLALDTCEDQNDASLSEEVGLPIAAMAIDECAPEANTMKEIAAAEVDVEDCAGSKYCDQCDEEAKQMGNLKQTESSNNESSSETALETPGALKKQETATEMETVLERKIGSLDDQKDESVTIFEEDAIGSIRGGAESVKTYPVYLSPTKMLNSPQFLNVGGQYNGTNPRRQNSSFQLEELSKASSEKSNNPTEIDADGSGTDLEGPNFQSYSVNEAVSTMNDSVTNREQHDCIDQKQVTELCPSLGLSSHGKLEEIASSIDNSYESCGTMYEVMASLGKESDCLPTLGSEPLGVEREETTIFQKCHSQDSLDCSRQEEIVGTIFNKMAPNEDETYAGEATDEKTTVDAKLVNDNVMDEGPQKETHMQLILPELRTREDDEAFHIIPDRVELNTERFNIIADTIGDDGIDESRSTSLEVMTSLVKGSECLLQIHEVIEESKPLNVERGEILQEFCGQDSAYLVSDAAEICTGEATDDAKLDGGEDIDEMEVKDSVHDTAVSSIVSGNDAVYLEIQNILGRDLSDISPSSHEENNDEYHEISPDSCAADNVTDEGPHKESHMQPTLPELQTREVDEVFHLIPDIRELNVDKSGIIADTVGGDDMNESRATSLKVTTSLEKGSERLLQIHEMIQENEPLNVEREEISTVQEFCGQDSAYLFSSAAEISAGEATNGAQLDGDEDTDEMEVKDPVQDTADLVTGSGNDAVSLVKENYFGQHSSDQSPSSHEENNDEYHEIAPDSCAANTVTDEGPHKESHMQSTLPELQTKEVDEVFHLIPDIIELDVDKSTIGGDDMDESRATSLEVTSLEKGSERLLQIHDMIQESEPLNVEREEISTVQEFCGHDSAYLVSSAAEICASEATNVVKLYGDEDTCTDEMEVKDLVQDTADSVTGSGNDAVSLEKENYFGQHSSDQSPSSYGNDFLEGEYQVFTEWEMRLFSSGPPKELEKEPTGSQQKGDSKLIDLIEMTDGEVFTELEIRLLSAESTGSQQKDDTEMIDLIEMTDSEVFTEIEIRLLSPESTGSKRVNENADHSELREDLIVPKDLVVENENLKAAEVHNLEDSGSAVCKDLVVENVDPKTEEVSNLEDSGSALCNEAFLYNKKSNKEEEHESFLENSIEIRNLSNANSEDDSTVVKECTDCYNEGIACNDSRMVECATALCDPAINIDDRAAQENLRLSNHSGELNTDRSNVIADTIGGDDTDESAPTSLEVMTSPVKENDCLLQIHEMIPESEPFGVERGVQECCHEDSANLDPNALEIGSGEAVNGAKLDHDEDTDEMGVKDPVPDTAVSCMVSGNDAVSPVLQNDFGQDSSDGFPSSHVNDFLEGEYEVFTDWEMRLFSSGVPKELEKEPTGSQQKEETERSRHNTGMVGDLLEMTDTDVFTIWEMKLLSEEYTGSERADDNADPSEARGDPVVSKDLVDENENLKADEVSNFEGSGNAICNEAFLYDKKPNQEEEHESFPDNSIILSKGNCEDDSTIVKERADCDNEDKSCMDSRIVECTTAPSDSTMNIDEIVAQEKLRCSNHIISSSMGRTEGKPDVVAVTPKKPVNIFEMKENVVSSKGQHLTATKSVAKRQPLMDLQQKLI